MSVAEATTGHGWVGAMFIGIENGAHEGGDHVFGIAPSPDYVVQMKDIVLFVSDVSQKSNLPLMSVNKHKVLI